MQVFRLSNLFVIGALAVCGCSQEVQKQTGSDVILPSELRDIRLPESVPNFSVFDFGLAEIDEEDPDKLLYGRTLFQPRQVTKEQTYTVNSVGTVEKEITDESGKKQTVVEEIQVPENRTRTVTMTVYEVIGDQISSCPIQSVTAYDRLGKQLSEAEMRNAFKSGCRAILRGTESPDEPYYGGFFDSKTLFIHSNEWVDIDYVPSPASPAPEVRVSNRPLITDLAIAS